MKPTKAMLRVLRSAERDGCLTIGGLDATKPRVRSDVLCRLIDLGYLKTMGMPDFFCCEYALTNLGREVMKKEFSP